MRCFGRAQFPDAKPAHPEPPSGQKDENLYTSKVALCERINAGHTALIDARFFIDQRARGGTFLTRQEMEAQFPKYLVTRIRPEEIWEMKFDVRYNDAINMSTCGVWLLVAISYPWRGKAHPDRDGVQLATLARFFERLVADLNPFEKQVAVFLDFGSFYQDFPAKRTAEQHESFSKGLMSVNIWYGHQAVVVVALTDVIDDRAENKMPYHGRGWTTFEYKVSLLVSNFVFDLARMSKSSSQMLQPLTVLHGEKLCKLGSLKQALVRAEPPTLPHIFNNVIAGKVFTNGKDQPFIKNKYKETFHSIMSKIERMDFRRVSWSREDVEMFATGVAPMCPCLSELVFSDVASVTDFAVCEVVKHCPKVELLDLHGCPEVTGIAVGKVVEHWPNLWFLDLTDCDVADVAIMKVAENCRKLQRLGIGNTKVTDQGIRALAENCHGLKLINIQQCSQVTDKGIVALAENCHDLQDVFVDFCQVTYSGILALVENCKGLKILTCHGCATGLRLAELGRQNPHITFSY